MATFGRRDGRTLSPRPFGPGTGHLYSRGPIGVCGQSSRCRGRGVREGVGSWETRTGVGRGGRRRCRLEIPGWTVLQELTMGSHPVVTGLEGSGRKQPSRDNPFQTEGGSGTQGVPVSGLRRTRRSTGSKRDLSRPGLVLGLRPRHLLPTSEVLRGSCQGTLGRVTSFRRSSVPIVLPSTVTPSTGRGSVPRSDGTWSRCRRPDLLSIRDVSLIAHTPALRT